MAKFDVAILGAGPGGYVCAIRCAQYGLKTVLIEERELGGTCLNRGCIPTKTMLHSAQLFYDVQSVGKFGVQTGDVSFDFGAIANRRDKIIAQLRLGVAGLEKANGVTLLSGRGVLKSSKTIEVNSEILEADRIILAPGSRPILPPIEGIDGKRVLTSDDVLKMTECPESLVIVGGGVIGIEFASLFASLGKRVTVLEMAPSILPGTDPEIVKLLLRKFRRLKIDVETGVKVTRISSENEAIVEFEAGGKTGKATGAFCVVCAGRKGNTDRLGLEEVGVRTERGFIPVDDRLQTSVPGILAVGDATGQIQLAHAASAQGAVAAAVCAGRNDRYRGNIIPACLYTSPEIASVGLTEDKALKEGKNIRVGRFSIPSNGKALVMGTETGLVKIVSDAVSGEIYGAQIIGPRATDMIAEIAAVMTCEGTIEELASTVHPHPTISETIGEAADDALGLCCHAAPVKR